MTGTETPQVVMGMAKGNDWFQLGSVSIDEPPGSIHSWTSGEYELFVFGWVEGQRGLFSAGVGLSVENSAVRQIVGIGARRLSDLSEPYELDIAIAPGGQPFTVRFSYEGP